MLSCHWSQQTLPLSGLKGVLNPRRTPPPANRACKRASGLKSMARGSRPQRVSGVLRARPADSLCASRQGPRRPDEGEKSLRESLPVPPLFIAPKAFSFHPFINPPGYSLPPFNPDLLSGWKCGAPPDMPRAVLPSSVIHSPIYCAAMGVRLGLDETSLTE